MEEDLLAENNAFGQALLHMVSRGNAIIAELLRLKDYIPSIFRLETKEDVQKYGELLMDFSYFSNPEIFEKKIDKNIALYKLDEEIREKYKDLLERFYLAYESIYKYITDLNTLIDELDDGLYLQQNLDIIFMSTDGVQLMCESVYLYGVQLLVLDLYHPGPVRERLVLAHSRYSISAVCIDMVCRLIRCTGASVNKRPPSYPVDYFRRIPVEARLVENVLTKLRTEDIYHQTKSLPDHSTTALAPQAAVLFVVLFFCPNVLNQQASRMREIVDKFFPDNWIVNVYMGITMNLLEMWDGFKAAKTAINNVVEPNNIHEISQQHAAKLEDVLKRLNEMLKEGFLSKSSVLDQTQSILCLIRESNVTLRWLLLHTSQHKHHVWKDLVKKCKTTRDQVLVDVSYNEEKLVKLLLNSARYENIIKDLYKKILQERSIKWLEAQKEAALRLEELSDIFAGTKPLIRVNKSESLKRWFNEMKDNVNLLVLDEPNVSARKIVQLVQALDEVQGYPTMESNLQTKQLAVEAIGSLRLMLSAASVRDSVLVQVQVITDFSYGWLLVSEFTPFLQNWVTSDPTLLNNIRSLLYKLSSAMESCLIRMNQAGEEGDLSSVSLYYSGVLVSYAKDLLQVIPSTVFKLMSCIADLQTTVIPDLPARLDKDKLKQYAHLEARFQVAKESSEVCVFSSGLGTMESTLLGVVRIEPKLLLEEGIRKELSQHIRTALSHGLVFNTKGSNLNVKLTELAAVMDGNQRSFVYVQDYMDIQGSKMWQEEMRRVVEESVEDECERIRRADMTTPGKLILAPPSLADNAFMGRLSHHIISLIQSRLTLYLESEWSWYQLKSRTKVLDSKIWAVLAKAIGSSGLLGLSKIFAFYIVKNLQHIMDFLTKECQNNKAWNEMFSNVCQSLKPHHKTPVDGVRTYTGLTGKVHKLIYPFSCCLPIIGCLQLLRKQLAYTQNLLTNTHAPLYTATINTLSQHLLEDVCQSGNTDEENAEGKLDILLAVGLSDVYQQLYVTSHPIPYLALLTFLYTMNSLERFSFDKDMDCLVCKKTGESIYSLALGVSTFLHQFHQRVSSQYIAYCAQYTKVHLMNSLNSGKECDEATNMFLYLEEYLDYSGRSRKEINQHIPDIVLDLFSNGLSYYTMEK